MDSINIIVNDEKFEVTIHKYQYLGLTSQNDEKIF